MEGNYEPAMIIQFIPRMLPAFRMLKATLPFTHIYKGKSTLYYNVYSIPKNLSINSHELSDVADCNRTGSRSAFRQETFLALHCFKRYGRWFWYHILDFLKTRIVWNANTSFATRSSVKSETARISGLFGLNEPHDVITVLFFRCFLKANYTIGCAKKPN